MLIFGVWLVMRGASRADRRATTSAKIAAGDGHVGHRVGVHVLHLDGEREAHECSVCSRLMAIELDFMRQGVGCMGALAVVDCAATARAATRKKNRESRARATERRRSAWQFRVFQQDIHQNEHQTLLHPKEN
jgi:hypothetical protein